LKEIRKVLHEVLLLSLNTDQMNHLGRDVDQKFSLAEVSGFGEKIVIPRKVGADCVIDYFSTEESLLRFIAYMISRNGQGASGGVIHLKSLDKLISLLREKKWIYDPEKVRFQRDQSEVKMSDWGFMKEGEEYSLTFCSIDIVASSELVKTNVKVDVEATMSAIRNYVQQYVNDWNGRIWFWYGDGGVAAFYGNQAVSGAALSMISILSYLPVFNITKNELRPESDIKLRIGIHYGQITYLNEAGKMTSADLRLAQEVEKHCAETNTIAITETAMNLLHQETKARFTPSVEHSGLKIYRYYP